MRVLIKGFGRYSDTLSVEMLTRIDYRDIAGILNIEGAIYYYVDGITVGVRYSKLADPRDVAAQTLAVIAGVLNIPVEEIVVIVDDSDVNVSEFADEVWQRACTTPIPEPVSVGQIELRGSGPAYWLRS